RECYLYSLAPHRVSSVYVLCNINGILFFRIRRSAGRWRCRRRADARSLQHVTGRVAQPVTETDALARRAAIHRRYYNHVNGLGDGAVGSEGPDMVVLNRIYTRTGDDGTTALGTGERRKKYDLRIACYGTVDEVN